MILLRFDPMGSRTIGIEIVISCSPFNRHNPALEGDQGGCSVRTQIDHAADNREDGLNIFGRLSHWEVDPIDL
jgi:hypothetical protein